MKYMFNNNPILIQLNFLMNGAGQMHLTTSATCLFFFTYLNLPHLFSLNQSFSHFLGLSIFKLIFVFILTYGHECWVMTKRARSPVQVAKIGFLQKVEKLWPCDTNVLQMNSKATNQLMEAFCSGKRPRGKRRTCWQNYAEDLA